MTSAMPPLTGISWPTTGSEPRGNVASPAGTVDHVTRSALRRSNAPSSVAPVIVDAPDATGAEVFEERLWEDLQRILAFAALECDWDSYGAEPISHDAIEGAQLLLSAVASQAEYKLGRGVKPYAVAPLADGGVQIEWRGAEYAIEVEISPDGRYGYLVVTGEPAEPTVMEEAENLSLIAVIPKIVHVIGG